MAAEFWIAKESEMQREASLIQVCFVDWREGSMEMISDVLEIRSAGDEITVQSSQIDFHNDEESIAFVREILEQSFDYIGEV